MLREERERRIGRYERGSLSQLLERTGVGEALGVGLLDVLLDTKTKLVGSASCYL